MGGFEILPHTADVLIRAWGNSLEDALKNAILGFYEVMTDIKSVEPRQEEIVRAEGFDLESMLYNLVEALIVLFDEKAFLASQVKSILYREKDDTRSVEATLLGEPFDATRHESRVLIKAATYHLMKIWREGDRWLLQYVVDI